jgi:hypothetical protein
MVMMTKLNQVNKLGRNDICLCGSGKKYKKCCLYKNLEQGEDKHMCGQEALVEEVKERFADKEVIFLRAEEVGLVKLSEIIMEFAEELLDIASTKMGKEKAIMLAVTAWNLAFEDKKNIKSRIKQFFRIMKIVDVDEQENINSVLHVLIK